MKRTYTDTISAVKEQTDRQAHCKHQTTGIRLINVDSRRTCHASKT